MRFFWKTVAANLVATLITVGVLGMVAFVGFVICLRAIITVGASAAHHDSTHANSVLVFDLDTAITDSPEHAAPGDLFGGGTSRISLYDVTQVLEAAAKDKNIVALYLTGSLDTDNTASGYATLKEVRQAIEKFKASGKKVYAYLIEPTLKDYYLASTANEISLNPFGLISINGIGGETFYLHDALEKYGVGVQVTRVGKYKSYVEMFTENHMSDADREQLTQLLGGIWKNVLADVAASRKVDVATLTTMSNDPGLFLPPDALKDKLVDKLAYLDEMIAEMEKVGATDDDNNTFYQVALSSYAKRLDTKRDLAQKLHADDGDHIAVVYAEGDIVDGGSGSDNIGGDEFASMLRDIRNDDNVKAVVLRVNSPGGSVGASETIQREVRQLREKKVPVVVSMGTYAASGGYWISAYSDYIYAEPTTVTGSIGVFGLKLNLQAIANDHGVSFDGVKTAPYADMDTLTRPWTPDEQKLAQTLVDTIYDQFIDRVAIGRKLQPDKVREIAQGRVWSGEDAKKLGLVDGIGGLGDAIAKAEDLAHLKGKSWSLQQFPEKRTALEAFAQTIMQKDEPSPVSQIPGIAGKDPVSATIRQVETQWKFVKSFNDPRGMYARLPFNLEF